MIAYEKSYWHTSFKITISKLNCDPNTKKIYLYKNFHKMR